MPHSNQFLLLSDTFLEWLDHDWSENISPEAQWLACATLGCLARFRANNFVTEK